MFFILFMMSQYHWIAPAPPRASVFCFIWELQGNFPALVTEKPLAWEKHIGLRHEKGGPEVALPCPPILRRPAGLPRQKRYLTEAVIVRPSMAELSKIA
jgi:hypothetical protein